MDVLLLTESTIEFNQKFVVAHYVYCSTTTTYICMRQFQVVLTRNFGHFIPAVLDTLSDRTLYMISKYSPLMSHPTPTNHSLLR